MNAALNGLGSQLFGWFGQLSIELAVLALIVLAAGRLLPIKSPAFRHLLWVVVLLKPIVAVAVSSPFTLFTPFAPLVPLAETGRDALAFLPVEPPTVHAAAFPIIPANSVGLTAAGWGAMLWMAGASLLIGRILIGYGVLWRLRRQAQVQRNGPLFDALRQARQEFDCYPRVEVATSSSIGSPMALGILRPLIVFPADLVDKLRSEELSLILMHEMAHVRRCDNLLLLLQRLVAAALFFHPAVWLCGRMLRREAEHACDDLVVSATGREKAYARGLAHVAERGARFNPLVRRIPTMNAFAAAESDLALRIRRTLAGGGRRMGTRARVLASVLLCPLASVTLPSCGATGNRTGGDMAVTAEKKAMAKASEMDGIWRVAMTTTFSDPREEERKSRPRVYKDSTTKKLAEQQRELLREARTTDPDEWSEELKAGLLAHSPNSTIERIAWEIRQARLLREARATDPDEWSKELKAQLLVHRPNSTIEEIAEEIHRDGLRKKRSELIAQLLAIQDSTIEEVRQQRLQEEPKAIDQDEWSEEMNAQLLALKALEMENLLIVVDRNGNIKLNQKPVTLETLEEQLQTRRQRLDRLIIIQGDERAPHGQIVKIMEIARQAGLVDQVIIATDISHN